MVVGKTSPSTISMTEIFSMFSETQVLGTVFPDITEIPCLINSPLRVDRHPSFRLYMSEHNHIRYIDFATRDRGTLLDLLCKYWDCTFNQALDRICKLMVKDDNVTIKPKQIKTFTRKEANSQSKIEVKVRPWRDYDYEYWASYGITKPWLKYAEIYPISYKIVTKKDLKTGKSNRYIFPAQKYTFCYIERKENNVSLKIYSPFDQKHKWYSKMDASVISLWTKVPEYGDKIIIASSTKDALCISSNLHIPAIAPQGEGYNLSNTAIAELKRRYKKVYIAFDGDNTGKVDARKMSEITGFPVITCPIIDTPIMDNENVRNLVTEGLRKQDKAKDWSDIYLYFGRDRFIKEFNKAINHAK